jgi:hypothetical protein
MAAQVTRDLSHIQRILGAAIFRMYPIIDQRLVDSKDISKEWSGWDKISIDGTVHSVLKRKDPFKKGTR